MQPEAGRNGGDSLGEAAEVGLRITGFDTSGAVRSLQEWLVGREELQGRVRPVVRAPVPGAMGSTADMLVVALGHGGAATATASVLISWIRRQRGKISVTAKRPDGAEITLTADHVRGLAQEDIQPLVGRLAEALDGGELGNLRGEAKANGGTAT